MPEAIGPKQPHIVIIGGGFGGLYAAKALGKAPVRVTLLDRRNFHLFQPLLYQVATGGLSPGEIASPLRAVLKRNKNTTVLQAEVTDIDPEQQMVTLRDGSLSYDTLIVATGVTHHYFGHDEWESEAGGLKTIEDALTMRRRIFLAFEAAEREPDPAIRRAWLTFVIVGGGPTGVELAGAVAELAHNTLKNNFRAINPAEAQILLIEGEERILPPFPAELSAKAEASLAELGAAVRTNALVTDIDQGLVTVKQGDQTEQIAARTILWAAGVRASPMGRILADKTGVSLDRAGRVMVTPNLTIEGYPNLFVIGDLAHYAHQSDQPLPGVAPVAMQQGRYMADLIKARQQGRPEPSFHYTDKGSLAVIGRNAAVAKIGPLQFSGFPAWFIWIFVHLMYLVEYENQLLVLMQWAWSYITRNRGARLITGDDPFPLVQNQED